MMNKLDKEPPIRRVSCSCEQTAAQRSNGITFQLKTIHHNPAMPRRGVGGLWATGRFLAPMADWSALAHQRCSA